LPAENARAPTAPAVAPAVPTTLPAAAAVVAPGAAPPPAGAAVTVDAFATESTTLEFKQRLERQAAESMVDPASIAQKDLEERQRLGARHH
jgi:hypothetical protein